MSLPDTPDVLIVGSGPIGSTFARTLLDARPDTEVLMIDAGPQLTVPPGMHVRNIADERERVIAQVRSQSRTYTEDDIARVAAQAGRPPTATEPRPGTAYVDPEAAASGDPETLTEAALSTDVGGMGAHWTCACPHPAGRELPLFIPSSEWEPAVDRARALLAVTPNAFPATVQGEAALRALRGEFDGELPEGRRVQPMPLACSVRADGTRYWTGTDVILGRLATDPPPTFHLASETLCARLVVDGERVAAAVLRDLATGAERTIRPRFVVVAADGLRTPQLLWASGIRPRALGRYLNDHLQVMSGVVLDPALAAAVTAERGDRELLGGRRDDEALVGIFWIPYSDEHPFHGQVMHMDLSPMPMGSGTTADSRHVLGVGYFVPKDIRADDRVVFSETELDTYGMPRIHTRYHLTDRDRAALTAVQRLQVRAATALGSFAPGREPSVMPNGSSLHYQGTFRMGAHDDGTSVCDPTCRVWGLRNLVVGGNGVIPTPTAGNSTLTSVAHAVRAADELVRAVNDRPAAIAAH